jgi:MFS family permease
MARSPDISKGATAGGEIDETTTLLPSSETTESLPQTQGCPPNTTPTLYRSSSSWPWTHVVVLCMALAIISDIGEDLFAAPKVRLFESVVCTHYYSDKNPSYLSPDGTVQEKLCKIDPVQDEVAFILGWQLFFDSIPAILLPIPYGYIADKHGRKWILCLALAGYTLSWASTLFLLYSQQKESLVVALTYGKTGRSTSCTTSICVVVVSLLHNWRWSHYRNHHDYDHRC